MRHTLAIAAALVHAGTVSAEPLRVLNWSDYTPAEPLAAFEAETGLQVELDVYESGETAESVLLSGGGGYDLVVVSSEYLERLAAEDVIVPFDPDLLPGLAGLDPAVAGALASLDPDGRAVPYLYGTTGLAYDRPKVLERMPDAPLDSWSLLFDPQTAARLSDCGIALVDAPEEALAAALLWLGRDPNEADAKDLDAAFAALEEIAPFVQAIDSALMEPFASGDFCVALAWSTDIVSAAAEAEPNVDLFFGKPREGALLWFDVFVIPKNALATAGAHAFVDFLLQPEQSASAAQFSWVASPVSGARDLMPPEITDHPGVFPDLGSGRLSAIQSFTSIPKHEIASRWLDVKLLAIPQ